MGNIHVDQGKNPLLNNNFLLRVEAIYDLPCRKISNIKMEEEYETIQEGGVNDYVHLRKKPVSKPHTIVVERYVGINFLDPFLLGKRLTLPLMLYVSRYANDFEAPKSVFTFTGCTVIEKSYGELNAEVSGLMVQTITIAFEKFYVIHDFFEEPRPTWEFDSTGRKMEGFGKRRAVRNTDEVRKQEMKKQARIWPETRSARNMSDFMK